MIRPVTVRRAAGKPHPAARILLTIEQQIRRNQLGSGSQLGKQAMSYRLDPINDRATDPA